MPGVFISYRREDSSAYAGRLFDILSTHFGRENTFMDLDTIEGGDDFTAVIDRKLGASDALVAVIGDHWLTVTEQNGGRRLDNENDFVRVEIAKALEHGTRVIPVLVGGATMPHPSDLPANLQAMCKRQAMEVRDTHFHADAQQLIGVLDSTVKGRGLLSKEVSLNRFLPVALVAIGLAIGVSWMLLRQQRVTRLDPAPVVNEQTSQKTAPVPPTTDVAAGTASSSAKPPAPLAASGTTRPSKSSSPPEASGTADPGKTPASAAGDIPASRSAANLAGEWTAVVRYDWGDTYKEWFDFAVDGQELSGSAGFLGDRKGDGRPLWDGKIDSDRISFMTKTLSTRGADGKTYEDKHYYHGKVNGETIVFTMVTDSSSSEHAPIHFTAIRVK